MPSLRSTVALLACVGVVVAPAVARAQPDAAIAEQLFRDGRTLLEAGHVDEACEKFFASQRVAPAIGTQLNLALCRERQGKTATAWSLFADVEAQALRAGDRPRGQIAHDHEAALGSALRKVVIDLSAPPTNTVVRLDGESLPAGALGTEMPVDPGPHTLSVTASGKKPWERSGLDVSAQTSPLHVRVDLEDAPAQPLQSPPPTMTAPTIVPPAPNLDASHEPPLPSHRGRWPSYVAFGVGAVGLVTGSIAGGLALSDASDAKSHCQGTVCGPDAKGPVSSAKNLATVSDVGFAVGLVGVATGVALWIWAPVDGGEPSVGLLVGPSSVSLAGSFR